MAILEQSGSTSGGFDISDLAPQGEFVATCIGIDDQMQVERLKFGSIDEYEKVNLTRFLFGFKGQDNNIYKVQTFEMKISGNKKSSLIKFITDWLGASPTLPWDYEELLGQGAVITVSHQTSQKGTTYAKLSGVRPVKSGLSDFTDKVIPLEKFEQAANVSGEPKSNTDITETDDCPF